MRVGKGVSRSEPDRCYRGNNRVILDRAYGKAALLIQGNVDYGISDQLSDLIKGNAGNSLGAEIARRAFAVWWISPLRAGHAFGPPLA